MSKANSDNSISRRGVMATIGAITMLAPLSAEAKQLLSDKKTDPVFLAIEGYKAACAKQSLLIDQARKLCEPIRQRIERIENRLTDKMISKDVDLAAGGQEYVRGCLRVRASRKLQKTKLQREADALMRKGIRGHQKALWNLAYVVPATPEGAIAKMRYIRELETTGHEVMSYLRDVHNDEDEAFIEPVLRSIEQFVQQRI